MAGRRRVFIVKQSVEINLIAVCILEALAYILSGYLALYLWPCWRINSASRYTPALLSKFKFQLKPVHTLQGTGELERQHPSLDRQMRKLACRHLAGGLVHLSAPV